MKLPKDLKEREKEKLKARSKQKRKKKKYRLGSSRSMVHSPEPKKKFYESFTPYLVVIGVIFVIGVVFIVINFDNPDISGTTDNSDPYGTDITFQTIEGTTIELSDHQGQFVILYFFDLGCAPCAPEADVISDIDDVYSNSRVFIVLVTVHSWDSDDGLNQFKIDHDLNRPIVRDDNSGTYGSHFNIAYTPTTILLDEDGNEVNRYIGHDTNHFDQIKSAIDGL